MDRCPLCLKKIKKTHTHFVQCTFCKTIYFIDAKTISYENNYFNNEYHSQYGKTYFEDQENICQKAQSRIDVVKKTCVVPQSMRILEIGSAAGFFLEQAGKNWSQAQIQGWEISKTMAEFSKKRGNQVHCGNYFDLFRDWKQSRQDAFDFLFAFYTLEHFDDQNAFWHSVEQLVKPNGYFVFTIPSFNGPMFYLHRKKWIETHPRDHFVDYSPHSLKILAKIFSFELVHVSADAVHPERIFRHAPAWIKKIIAALQRKFSFADTILVVLKRIEKNHRPQGEHL